MVLIRVGKFKSGKIQEWENSRVRNSSQEQLRKTSSTIGPPAGIEPTPLRCRCNALTTKLRR